MESPEGQRRAIEEYLYSQSGPDFSVEHVEKVNSESILGRDYDVWDAHTNEGRWWVITPPTNLYSQEQIKSMDIALSFHIGLMARMEARNPVVFREAEDRTWILEVLRRLETASDSLDGAKEVEDVQAVGMRLRESLLSLIAKMREIGLSLPPSSTLPTQDGNFKEWAAVFANTIAPGRSLSHLRKLLKSQSDCTWELLGWLTHARNASHLDGRLALEATNSLVELFLFALARAEREALDRCPACSSYQVEKQMAEPGEGWLLVCSTCGWSRPTDPPGPPPARPPSEPREEAADSEDCIPLQDFGIFLTPGQARAALQATAAQIAESEQPAWANNFAVQSPEDGSMHDVHRLVHDSFNPDESAIGAELVYGCAESNCVNPKHAAVSGLKEMSGWQPGVVERVLPRADGLELLVSDAETGRRRVLSPHELLTRYGLGDGSSVLERVVFIAPGDEDGQILIVPAARRIDLSDRSIVQGWVLSEHETADENEPSRDPAN
jgi:hypothetical protein